MNVSRSRREEVQPGAPAGAPASPPATARVRGKRAREIALLLGVAILGVAWAGMGCGFPGTSRPVEKSGIAMDTFVRVKVYGAGADQAAEAALEEFKRLDALLDPYDESSEVAAVNRSAGAGPVKVSGDTLAVVERALWYAARTGGAFDPTVLPLVRAWGFPGPGTPRVPSREEIQEALALVDYRNVRVDRDGSTITLLKKGMGLDPGAIAKGYATDRAVAVLRERGVRSAVIDAGGNVYAVGTKPRYILRPTAFTVGIRHPRRPGVVLATARVTDESVVTSGDYQRFFESGGVRYHHILDPATGQPARWFQSVTVIGTSSTDCDALSTSIFVMGEEKGFKLLQDLTGFGAVAVRADGTVVTSGNAGVKVDVMPPGPGK